MFKSIMVPVSDPTTEVAALQAAVRLARASAARLHVVHVHEKRNGAAHDRETTALLEAVRWAADELDESVSFRALERVPAPDRSRGIVQALQDYARANTVDLIVMARRRHSVNRLLFGSIGEDLLLTQDVPILFVPQHEKALPGRGLRTLVALDGTRGGEAVLTAATELTRALNGSLTLMRVLTPVARLGAQAVAEVDAFIEEEGIYGEPSARDYLDELAQRVEAAGVKVSRYTLPGKRASPTVRKIAAHQRVHVVALAPRPGDEPAHFAPDSVTEALLRKSETALLAQRRAPNQH
jgi:nucleotide-binding universal stress UspA family protein